MRQEIEQAKFTQNDQKMFLRNLMFQSKLLQTFTPVASVERPSKVPVWLKSVLSSILGGGKGVRNNSNSRRKKGKNLTTPSV